MPPAQRHDPYRGFNFRVEIAGVAVASFAEVSGLASETAVVEYRTGDDVGGIRKLPGLTRYRNIVLRRGVTRDRELWDWRAAIVNGKPDRRDGSIVLLDEQFQEVVRWSFFNGWPCRWEGPDLDARGNEVAIETLELAHEGLERA